MRGRLVDTEALKQRLYNLTGNEAIRLIDKIGEGGNAVLFAINRSGYSTMAQKVWDSMRGDETKQEMALDWVWELAMDGNLSKLGWDDLTYEDEEEVS